MTLTLRERRRLQTSQDIHMSTIALAGEHGLDSVTTEMIAEAAAISLRTFFNYYPNKEAAVVGHLPGFPEEAVRRFTASHGSLPDDLGELLAAHLDGVGADRAMLRTIIELTREHPKVAGLLDSAVSGLKHELRGILAGRLDGDDRQLAELLSAVCMETIRQALDRWVAGEEETPRAAIDAEMGRLRRLAQLLA